MRFDLHERVILPQELPGVATEFATHSEKGISLGLVKRRDFRMIRSVGDVKNG